MNSGYNLVIALKSNFFNMFLKSPKFAQILYKIVNNSFFYFIFLKNENFDYFNNINVRYIIFIKHGS